MTAAVALALLLQRGKAATGSAPCDGTQSCQAGQHHRVGAWLGTTAAMYDAPLSATHCTFGSSDAKYR